MPAFTLGRLAKLYGMHRSTVYEAVEKGRVSAGLDGKGQKVIDLSEAIRVWGEPPGNPTAKPDTRQPAPGESWIPWRGGECPLPPSTPVEYRMRRDARSVVRIDLAGKLDWEHHGGRIGKSDVVAYRAALSAQGDGDASA